MDNVLSGTGFWLGRLLIGIGSKSYVGTIIWKAQFSLCPQNYLVFSNDLASRHD